MSSLQIIQARHDFGPAAWREGAFFGRKIRVHLITVRMWMHQHWGHCTIGFEKGGTLYHLTMGYLFGHKPVKVQGPIDLELDNFYITCSNAVTGDWAYIYISFEYM